MFRLTGYSVDGRFFALGPGVEVNLRSFAGFSILGSTTRVLILGVLTAHSDPDSGFEAGNRV